MIEFLKEQTELKEFSIFPDMSQEPDITALVGDTWLPSRRSPSPPPPRDPARIHATPTARRETRSCPFVDQGHTSGIIADQKLSRLAETLAFIAGPLQTLLTNNISKEASVSFTAHLPNLRFIGYCPRTVLRQSRIRM